MNKRLLFFAFAGLLLVNAFIFSSREYFTGFIILLALGINTDK